MGLDSFLDIVANLVGILIILVMVIGVHARSAIVAAISGEHEPAVADSAAAAAAAEQVRQLAAVESSVLGLAQQVGSVRREIDSRLEQRNRWQLAVSATRYQLDQHTAQLDEDQRRQLELQSQLAADNEELARVRNAIASVSSEELPPEIIEHMPTPLARTVFGEEEHFRLLGGRIVYVPLNQLTELLTSDAESKIYRLRETDSLTETIGPIGDFRMQYTLVKKTVTVDTQLGPARREVIELDRFVLVPVSDAPGEPLEQALQPGSLFLAKLSEFNPRSTTITVWSYPDSYANFRELKSNLTERGYLTAARPLPEGMPIGGSPNGSRSSSQ